MGAAPLHPDGHGFDLDQLRAQALPPVAGAAGAAGVGLLLYAAVQPRPIAPELIATAAALGGLCAVGYALSSRRPTLAAALLVVGLLAVLTADVALWLGPSIGSWLVLVVLAGAALRGWRCGALTAALASVALPLATGRGSSAGLDLGDPAPVLLCWAALGAYWLISRPLQAALSWAWLGYERAERLMEEARERQAELARLSKSLNETCYQLEVVNHELERARRAAEEAHRVKAEFAAAISHELRTPLNLIIGFSEMMVIAPRTYHGEVLPEGYRGDVQAIYRSACHLSSLVDDVLDLAEVEAHRMALEKEWVPLGRIADEAVATVATLFKDRGLSLAIDLPDDLPRLYVDRTRIRQVLINLLTNAARFTSRGGATLRARSDGRDVTVSVHDTGIGIPPEEVPSLFKPFHHAAGSAPGPYGGRGLGLAICRRLTELHGGAIWVESAPGQGSTFLFTLPLCETVVAASPREEWQTWARPGASEPEPLVALVAPDDKHAGLFQRYLDGYRVVRVDDLDEVRPLAERGALRALVLAAPLAGAARRRWEAAAELERVPIITCPLRTGGDGGLGPRVAKYLVKPIDSQQLRQAFASLGKPTVEVAIVDDDPEMVRLLSRMVGALSGRHRVVTAADGAEALALLRARPPDVVLLDLLMPGTDGYAVVEAMGQDPTLAAIPIVVASAWGAEHRRVTATELGISRAQGLPVGEAMRYLQTLLRGASHSAGPGTPAVPAV
jgi:signal transduction histidine kinase/CheY-like chemotaxis protein